jgi:hypothetical protein
MTRPATGTGPGGTGAGLTTVPKGLGQPAPASMMPSAAPGMIPPMPMAGGRGPTGAKPPGVPPPQ